jgi:iron complex outermembrane recepter protein
MRTISRAIWRRAPVLRQSPLQRATQGLIARGTIPAILFGAVFCAPASAQQVTSEQNQPKLQEVVVTGSLIKRTDVETPSPVQIITDEDLRNSGFNNVSDVLRNLAANGQGTLNQGFGQAFASGGTGIALRGLTVGDTLTLLDSKRMISYPLSDDGERSFVDVSAIPFNAVASVEVLKDGASALYGADAIAGVVNVKLKPTYVGAQFLGEGGATQHNDGWNYHASGIIGWGDLASDGYNMYVALDWHQNELIWGNNRSGLWTNLDWSYLPGGQNTKPGAIGANGLVYPDSATGYLLNPTTPNAAGVYPNGLPARVFLPGCTQQQQNADQCTFAFPGQIQPPTSQTNFLSKITKALANDWKLVVTASLFDSIAQQTAPPTEPAFGHLLQQTGAENGSLPLISWGPGHNLVTNNYPVISLPGSNPLNPFGQSAELVYAFPDVGPWVVDTETQTYRLYGDLTGSAAGWDLDASVGLMYARMSLDFSGGLIPTATQGAINNGSYVIGSTQNNIALVAPEASTSPSSTLDVLEFTGSRSIMQMPGGPLMLAAGVQYFHKAQNDRDPPSIEYGYQEGITNFTVGSQDDTAGFVEFGGKVLRNLEVNAAVRYDHYDTYGGQATPKFGVKYSPIEMLTIRGTWGKGFRAPSISESAVSGITFGLGNGFDPVLCPNGKPNVKGAYNALCSYPIVGVEPSNPGLKAVTSTNATFGVIFEPVQAFNISVDWYHVQLNNDIISASSTGSLANYISLTRGSQVVLPVCTNTPPPGTQCTTAPVLTPVGYPQYLTFPYLNAGTTKVAGFDLDLRSRFDLGRYGRLTGELNYTYISEYELQVNGSTFDLDNTHGPSSISGDTGNPNSRAVATLTWEQGPATVSVSANYIGSFHITDPTEGWYSCLSALQFSGVGYGPATPIGVLSTLPPAWSQFCSVNHFTDFNLYASYAVNDHVAVHTSVRNLGNSSPPIDLQTYGGGALYRYTTLDQDGAVGRFFLLGATFTF